MSGKAEVTFQCGAPSSLGPPGALCNKQITVPLQLGPGNDFTAPVAEGWTVFFEDRESPACKVRCPDHGAAS